MKICLKNIIFQNSINASVSLLLLQLNVEKVCVCVCVCVCVLKYVVRSVSGASRVAVAERVASESAAGATTGAL